MGPLFRGRHMGSIFYKAAFDRRFPVTLLLLERISEVFSAGAEEMGQSEVDSSLRKCLVDCGVVKKVTDDDITYLMGRLNTMVEESKDADDPAPPSSKKTFASSYTLWAHKLQTDHVCLLAAGFDYFLANRMYMEMDKEDLTEVAKQFLMREWEKIKIGYESVVYGFGGSYSGDDDGGGGGGNSNVVDISDGKASKSAMAELKKMGF